MKRIFLLISSSVLGLLIISSCNKNEPKPDQSGLFIKFFGTIGISKGQSLAEVNDGFVLVGSATQANREDTDILVVKTDKNGNRLWEKYIENPTNEEANDVRVKENGDIFVLGYKTQATSDSTDIWLIQLNSNGIMLNDWTYGVPTASEVGYSLQFLPSDSVLIAGTSTTGNDKDMYVLKALEDKLEWSRKVGVIGQNDDLNKVIPISESRFVWCGTAYRSSNESNVRLALSDYDGHMQWEYEYGQFNSVQEFGRDVVQGADGSFMVVGSRNAAATPNETLWMLNININGALLDSHEPLGTGSCGNSIGTTSDGNYIIAGYQTVPDKANDFVMAKINPSGGIEFKTTYGGERNDAVHKVIQSRDGGYVMFGISDLLESKNVVYALIKTDSEGSVNKKKKK